ncbi:MAG TPA: substrate-binding domain-containing protein [Roseiarcus sp.]|nr:substrate-binding domain-containing protein [Roseiarcus sp.]
MSITGLGPHGERAAPADKICLSETEAALARAARFTVAVVLHTTTSDWSRQELAGIVATLGAYSAAVVDVVDCGFDKEKQNRALLRLAATSADAVISIPIGAEGVVEGHRAISKSGKTLVLLDNVPSGLMPGGDYAAVVSADNFNLGEIAAELLSPHLPEEGVAGILTYGADFYATNEREIAFRKWIGRRRPDVTLVRGRFVTVEEAGAAFERLLVENDDLDGLFVAWDVPALNALSAIRARSRTLAVTTVDLGNAAAAELVEGDLLKGIAAQRPYDQGAAAAQVTLLNLVGRRPPPWIAAPGMAVTRDDVLGAYQVVWHAPAPSHLLEACRQKLSL